MVAEWSKAQISQIQVENTVAQVPHSNPARDLHMGRNSKVGGNAGRWPGAPLYT